jgi:hypothetical protein
MSALCARTHRIVDFAYVRQRAERHSRRGDNSQTTDGSRRGRETWSREMSLGTVLLIVLILDTPVGGIVPDVPTDSPLNPTTTPMQAPAPTDHYAGSVENSSRSGQLAVLEGSKRSNSFRPLRSTRIPVSPASGDPMR